MNTKIAIIGAGPCGLAQLRAFKSAEETGADVPETHRGSTVATGN